MRRRLLKKIAPTFCSHQGEKDLMASFQTSVWPDESERKMSWIERLTLENTAATCGDCSAMKRRSFHMLIWPEVKSAWNGVETIAVGVGGGGDRAIEHQGKSVAAETRAMLAKALVDSLLVVGNVEDGDEDVGDNRQ